jgi:hypothetical protein
MTPDRRWVGPEAARNRKLVFVNLLRQLDSDDDPTRANPVDMLRSPDLVRLLPIRAVEGSVLDGFGHMLRFDPLARFEIRNRARDPQDPVVGASRKPQPRDCILHQLLAFPIQFAKTTERSRRHLGVAENAEGLETARLALPSGQDALTDRRRFFTLFVLGQFFVFDGRNLDVQIDPVEQRTGDARKVALDQGRRAIAFVQRISVKAARVRIHILAPDARLR